MKAIRTQKNYTNEIVKLERMTRKNKTRLQELCNKKKRKRKAL